MKKKLIHIIAFAASLALVAPALGSGEEDGGLAASSQTSPTQATDASQHASDRPQIFIESGRYEFGTTVEGTYVLHDFIVTNRGNAPLVIEEVKTT